jgi:hypothetical protein
MSKKQVTAHIRAWFSALCSLWLPPVVSLGYCSTEKMKEILSSENKLDIISENSSLRSRWCENLISNGKLLQVSLFMIGEKSTFAQA